MCTPSVALYFCPNETLASPVLHLPLGTLCCFPAVSHMFHYILSKRSFAQMGFRVHPFWPGIVAFNVIYTWKKVKEHFKPYF